jgi:hypothetical protein
MGDVAPSPNAGPFSSLGMARKYCLAADNQRELRKRFFGAGYGNQPRVTVPPERAGAGIRGPSACEVLHKVVAARRACRGATAEWKNT